MKDKKRGWWAPSSRGVVLSVLGVVTLGVAILSMAVSYQILEPRFGAWAVPTVGALDALWCVFQATEILSGNNRTRARRVQVAGLALTAVNAAIPTADLILNGSGGFDLAVILTPVAIVATKTAWWIALPSLGRRMSAGTRQTIAVKRQQVADQLEEMEAEAAHRIELLELAKDLNQRVTQAETDYRLSVLKAQQIMTEELHEQAVTTAETVAEKALPPWVGEIPLPDLGTWEPTAPALPVSMERVGSGTPALDRHTAGTQVSALSVDGDAPFGTSGGRGPARVVTLADLAVVGGVPVPVPGEQLTGAQIGVVLRHLRYAVDPPMSYRQARDSFRRAGFVGSEERIRHAWAALLANEGHGETSEGTGEEESAEADA